jgi:receptor protein-tyrosine kinase
VLLGVLVGALVGAAGGQVVAAAGTPSYASRTELLVTARDAAGPSAAYVGGLFTDQRVSSYLQLVGTPALADRVEAERGTPVPAGAVDAEVLPGTTVLRVTARGPTGPAARSLADAYGRALADEIGALEAPAGVEPVVDVTVVETASEPVQVAPDRVRDLAAGALLGAVAGTGGALVAGRRRRRTLRCSADLAAVAGAVPVVVVLEPPHRVGPPSPLDGRRDAVFLARAVRSGPGAVDPGDGLQVLAVTGAVAEDHRPELALTVAHELVALGRRVLLVDAARTGPEALGALRGQVDVLVLDLPRPQPDDAPGWWGSVQVCYPAARHRATTPVQFAELLEGIEGCGVIVLGAVLDRVPASVALAEGTLHPYPPDRGRHGPAHRSTRPSGRVVVPVESR